MSVVFEPPAAEAMLPAASIRRRASPTRIASLVPSLTELVVALGLGARAWSRAPATASIRPRRWRVPKVGGTKTVNLAKLRRLRADPRAGQRRREPARHRRGDARLGRAAPKIVVTHPLDPEDNLALVDAAGDGLRRRRRAWPSGPPALCDALRARARRATRPEGRPPRRVLYLIWRDPWMTVARDTYLSRMLARVGWQTLPGAERRRGRRGALPGAGRRRAVAGRGRAGAAQLRALRLRRRHVADAQALCPRRAVRRVDGELLSWYGARAVAGPALPARAGRRRRLPTRVTRQIAPHSPWTSSSR